MDTRDTFHVGEVVRMKEGCKGAMGAGELALLVENCHPHKMKRWKLHAHARWVAIGASIPSDDQLHATGQVCYNPERWERLEDYPDNMKFYKNKKSNLPPTARYTLDSFMKEPQTFEEELENKLDESFPKGKSDNRGAALVMYAYAVILHRKYTK